MNCSGEASREWIESMEKENQAGQDDESDPESNHSGEIKMTPVDSGGEDVSSCSSSTEEKRAVPVT